MFSCTAASARSTGGGALWKERQSLQARIARAGSFKTHLTRLTSLENHEVNLLAGKYLLKQVPK